MRGVILVLAALLAACHAGPKPVTNEDIKDAILSLVQLFRDIKDKLERHEFRERNLGDQLKKALSTMDRKERGRDALLEGIVKGLAKLDEKMLNLETSMAMSEREKGSYQIDSVPLQSWMSNVEGILQQSQSREVFDKDRLSSLEESLDKRLDGLASKLDSLEKTVLAGETAEKKTIDRVEERLAKQSNWHGAVLTALEAHEKIMTDLRASGDTQRLEKLAAEMEKTTVAISRLLDQETDSFREIAAQFGALSAGQTEIVKTISENNELAIGFFNNLQSGYEGVAGDVRALEKVETVLVQTADNVIDSKRRLEYGVQQILVEVGDLVKGQGKDINGTMNRRFDAISEKILDNQNGALTNLSSKIETEISQVWRQIGIMYKQLTASAGALDVLQQQTETYVNGSLHTMDSMEGKVGKITARMTEFDENLNYLLGHFSLVTQEFNQIKTALSGMLDKLKSSFKEVKEEIEDVGRGPNPIRNSSDNDNIV